MAREAPLDSRALEAVEASDVVVVRGAYDRVELVLDVLGMPYTPILASHLGQVRLRPEQLLVINCPGNLHGSHLGAVRGFVTAGGSLFTTDWALHHVLEQAFPGYVAFNRRPTRDEVVRIEVLDHSNPFLRGVADPGEDPLWWLEGSSYPIRVLDPSVRVLIRSGELGARYGEAAVAVLFRHGLGEVFHMISQYYLQRTELRDARHRSSAAEYAASKGIAPDAEMDGLTAGEVESATSSARLLANLLAAKKRREQERRGARDA